MGLFAAVAVVFLGLTLLTFNRCMGRMNESPEVEASYVQTSSLASGSDRQSAEPRRHAPPEVPPTFGPRRGIP